MKRKWSLYVSEFGKIKEAEIKINHMLIFVGDNGSGKSYLMTLLWGLMDKSSFLLHEFDISKLKNYKECSEWLMSLKKAVGEGVIGIDLQKGFVNLFNEILELGKELLVRKIFNSDMSIRDLKIKSFQGSDIKYNCDGMGLRLENVKFGYPIDIEDSAEDYDTLVKNMVFYLCLYVIFAELVHMRPSIEQTLYFPAARTGFTLAYKTLLAGAVESAFSNVATERKSKSVFSEPVVNFLKRWTLLTNEPRKIKNIKDDIAEYIEKYLLKGKMKKDNMPLPDIFFVPEGSEEELPIHLTSSLITELAPLALFLKEDDSKTIIIEEPEAHLHLKVQIAMAKLLAKLLSKGVNVWITTHSDVLVQQINNLIKFNESDEKEKYLEKYNIREDESIDFNKVGVYEFRDDGYCATVTPAKGDKEGFEYPQFADTIQEQTNMVLELGSENYGDKV